MSTSEGLKAADLGDMERLARLASNPKDANREEIYLAVVSLYRVQQDILGPKERALMNDILQRVERDVRPAIRTALAERLADDPSAPIDIVLMLATDAIDVARPMLSHSPLLTDAHLTELIAHTSPLHQAAIAGRDGNGEAVTERIASLENEAVLLALLRNESAQISARSFDLLTEKAQRSEPLRQALSGRPDLPSRLRVALGLPSAHRDVPAKSATPQPVELGGLDRLVTKLAASGELRAGFLLRVLQQGQLELFDAGLAQLLGLSVTQSRERFYGGGPTAVALACRAVGIDRCVFPTVYTLSRQSHGMTAALSASERKRVDEVFTFHSKPTALAVLQAA